MTISPRPASVRHRIGVEAHAGADAWTYRRLSRSHRYSRRGHDTAVMVHLYYGELWESIATAISTLSDLADVFVTVPSGAHVDPGVRARLRRATVLDVPNRGRDVLPFVRLLPVLRDAGYARVLKLHTKKSVHFAGGHPWFEGMLAALLPSREVVRDILDLLSDPSTGMVGPAAYYYPLSVALADNDVGLRQELTRSLGSPRAASIMGEPRRHGFFAGTMFWGRVDALLMTARPSVRAFDPERGQVNGTRAHALERVFGVVCAERGRRNYLLDGDEMRPATLADLRLPSWMTSREDDAPLDPGR